MCALVIFSLHEASTGNESGVMDLASWKMILGNLYVYEKLKFSDPLLFQWQGRVTLV